MHRLAKVLATALAILVIAIAIGWFGRGVHEGGGSAVVVEEETRQERAAPALPSSPPTEQRRANPLWYSTEAAKDSDRFVNMERVRTDPEYEAVVRHHLRIKSYLNSPIRGSFRLKGLLEVLLANGYSIDDLMLAYVELHLRSTRETEEQLETRLRAGGLSEEEVETEKQRVLEAFIQKRHRLVTQHFDAHDNPEFVDQLISTVPEFTTGPLFTKDFLPELKAEEGERILRDDDWMTDRHREIIASYKGAPKVLTSSPTRAYPPFNLRADEIGDPEAVRRFYDKLRAEHQPPPPGIQSTEEPR